MAFGDFFKNAWNGASGAVQEQVASLATQAKEVAAATVDAAKDAAEWAAQTSAKVAHWSAQKAKHAVSATAHAAKATAQTAMKGGMAAAKRAGEKIDEAKTWVTVNANALGQFVRETYDQAKEWFNETVAGATMVVCKQALALENGVYRDAAAATALYGRAKRVFTAEAVDVDFNNKNFETWTGGMSIEESQILYEAETGKTISRQTIRTLFTDPEKAKQILLDDKDIHTVYRDILNGNIPNTIDHAVNDPNWIELSTGKAFFHGSLTRGNRKFVSVDGYREVVYTSDGAIDRRDVLKGTFNFFSPTASPDSHVAVDVEPYAVYGN